MWSFSLIFSIYLSRSARYIRDKSKMANHSTWSVFPHILLSPYIQNLSTLSFHVKIWCLICFLKHKTSGMLQFPPAAAGVKSQINTCFGKERFYWMRRGTECKAISLIVNLSPILSQVLLIVFTSFQFIKNCIYIYALSHLHCFINVFFSGSKIAY